MRVVTDILNASEVCERRLVMTSEDFCANCTKMLNQLLAQGFTRPIYFAALASDGLATSGSSETVTGSVQPLVKTCVTAGSSAIYLLPVNVLFVDPNAQVAHGIINSLGCVSCRILNS
jgi:hypothetical protein